LLIYESCGRWISYFPKFEEWIDQFLSDQTGKRGVPRVVVNLSNKLPSCRIDSNGRATFENSFWRILAQHKEQVAIMAAATTLRQAGARLSWRLSWEQTIEDLATELIHFDRLRAIARFRDVTVRFGVVAAIHLHTLGRNRAARLVFAPLAKEGVYRDRLDDGEIIGKNTMMAGALLHEMAQVGTDRPAMDLFAAAIQRGLLASMRVFDRGYSNLAPVDERGNPRGEQFVREFLQVDKARSLISEMEPRSGVADQRLRVVAVPDDVIQRPSSEPPGRRPKWQILGHQLNAKNFSRGVEADGIINAPLPRINLGIAIVLYGHQQVLNRDFNDEPNGVTGSTDSAERQAMDRRIRETLHQGECEASAEETADHVTLPRNQLPIMPEEFPAFSNKRYPNLTVTTPVIEFGKLITIERPDIETFRGIHNLLKNYVESEGQAGALSTPISVAVFGPPGSGKSFAIKQIAKCIRFGQKDILEEVEYNVAQFRSVDDLGEAVLRLTSIRAQGKIPLVFFDEFDCELNGPLGWLKYFLAPMQDGMFYGARQTIKFGRAIFVFAGGVHTNFDDFDPTSDRHFSAGGQNLSEEQKQRVALFRSQKGPDFVSRLRGHIDILSINTGDGHTKHIVRRAIVLRSLLETQQLTRAEGDCAVAEIDEDIVYALLTVDRFRHGTRSLEAILQMCTPIHGRIEKSSLPSRSQLHMHVNANEFFVRMFRGRYRAKPAQSTDERRQRTSQAKARKPKRRPVNTPKPEEPSPAETLDKVGIGETPTISGVTESSTEDSRQ